MGNVNPSLAGHFLHLLKSTLELRVCLVERDGGVDARFSTEIDDREQKITKFRLDGGMMLVEYRRSTRPSRQR